MSYILQHNLNITAYFSQFFPTVFHPDLSREEK